MVSSRLRLIWSRISIATLVGAVCATAIACGSTAIAYAESIDDAAAGGPAVVAEAGAESDEQTTSSHSATTSDAKAAQANSSDSSAAKTTGSSSASSDATKKNPSSSSSANASSKPTSSSSSSASASAAQKPVASAPVKYKAGWNKDAKGVWHYGNKNGTAHTGWLLLGRTWYYLDPANGGAMKTGWYQDTSKRWFYSNGSGAMLANRWLKTANTWYHVGANGARQTGWLLIGRTWYWLDPANAGAMKTGWYQDTSKRWFYSNGSGAMLANRWLKTANTWYHVGANGARQTGWLLIGRTWYWLYPEKAGAMAANTMCTIGNARYSFDSSGAMRANCQIRLENNGCGYASSSGAITRIGVFSGGKVILKDAKGRILTGWQRLAGAWFYGQAKTGIMHTGWLDVGGARYYLNSAGAMVTGTYTINGKSYTFASSGALAQVTGNAALDSRIVSFAKSQGSLWNCYVWVKNHKHTNWASSGGVTRYANGTHALTTPWVASEASRMLDGKTTDCYAFSSAFACLAKGLGYDAKVVNGYVPSRSAGWSAHSWVEIRQGNTTYVYDPDLGHSIPSVNFYGFTYSNAPTNYKK